MRLESDTDSHNQDQVTPNPLKEAILAGHTGIVEMLISHGANIHIQDRDGYDALMTAVKVCVDKHEYHYEDYASHARQCVRLLLQNGANPNAKDHAGLDVSTWVIRIGDERFAKLLVAHGVDTSRFTKHGMSLLPPDADVVVQCL